MAISIDWGTKIINVPKVDTTLVQASPNEIRQLDLDTFRLALNDLQDNEQGITYDTTHRHVAPITVGGVTLARVIEIINGYTVTFEDGQYAVNLVGANSNVADVANVNQVSIRPSNSAGLVDLAVLVAAIAALNDLSEAQVQAIINVSEAAVIAEIDSSEGAILTAIPAEPVEADIRYVNGVPVKGTGTTGDEWGPA